MGEAMEQRLQAYAEKQGLGLGFAKRDPCRHDMLVFAASEVGIAVEAKDAEIARLKADNDALKIQRDAWRNRLKEHLPSSLALGELERQLGSDGMAELRRFVVARLSSETHAKVSAEHERDQSRTELEAKTIVTDRVIAELRRQYEEARTAAANARREALEEVRKLANSEGILTGPFPAIDVFWQELGKMIKDSQPAAETQTPRYPTLENDVAWILAEYAQKHDSAEHEARLIAEHFRERQSEPIQPPARDVEGLAKALAPKLRGSLVRDREATLRDARDLAEVAYDYIEKGKRT